MMRSLYSGITGLRNHQTRMDVIGNNIANVNTVGFKASRTVFQDLYSQTLAGGSRSMLASGGLGGTNPIQIGLGVALSTIDVLHTPGASQYTGRGLDVMINDDGFFVIDNQGKELYTRAGNFYTDHLDYLVTSSGMFVMGYAVDLATGSPVDASGAIIDYSDPANADIEPSEDGTGTDPFVVGGKIWIPDYYDNVQIDKNGLITGYNPTTETTEYIAMLQMGTFANVNGLQKVGGNLYAETSNSGSKDWAFAGSRGAGQITPGSLEMSNVDLGAEFVDMIVTQRGFQANSRTITTSDQMLEELVNLKR